jgi:hypothetical protein
MTTNEINHHRTNTSKYTFSHNHQPTSNILRHISTPSLELFHNHHQSNALNLTRSSFGRHHIRKKQPRTNPNYVNIQIKTNDGTLRSTYIRLDDAKKCQTLTFSSSSSSSPNSSDQNSILCHSQTCLNASSDETINLDINEKSSLNNDENLKNNSHTLTNKKELMMKQFIPCTDGKRRLFFVIIPREKYF